MGKINGLGTETGKIRKNSDFEPNSGKIEQKAIKVK